MELQIQNISKQYGKKTAINNMSLVFKPGIYGLLGANGAGKTTFMNMICGLSKPNSGKIFYNAQEIDSLGDNYSELLGYLPQNFGYYPQFSGRDFLLFMAAVKGIENQIAKDRVIELFKLVGLEEVADKKIRTYSGGMKQRLGIAQALINDPKILVLDEPTAGLDPKERIRFRNILTKLSREKILILSTHIVSDIESIADYLIMLKKGELIVKGTVKKLLESINGMVWQGSVSLDEAEKIVDKYCVSQQRQLGDSVQLRIVSPYKPFHGAEIVYPNLEDLYICTYQDERLLLEEVKAL